MSAVDEGLDAAVQRVKRIASMSAYIVEDSLIERVVRAAREDVPALTQQARADELEDAARAYAGDDDPEWIDGSSFLLERAAAIREGREP